MTIESLERRQLLSVAASTLWGDNSIGTVLTYQVTTGVPVTETISYVTTSDGYSYIQRQTVTDSGVIQYGSAEFETALDRSGENTLVENQNDSFSPPEVEIPALMTAGQTYTTASTDSVSDAIHLPNVRTSTRTYSVTLASEAEQPVTVPTGTYNAYVVTETTSAPIDGGSTISTDTETLYIVPGIGTVETVSGGGSVIAALTSYSGGGSFTPSPRPVSAPVPTFALVSTEARSSLPRSVISGASIKKSVTVDVANESSAAVSQAATVSLVAVGSDGTDTTVASAQAAVKLKAGKTREVALKVSSLPASLPAGTYTLVTRITDATGGMVTTTSGQMVAVVAGHAQLSAVVRKVSRASVAAGRALTFTVTVKNVGNIPATGAVATGVFLSTDGTAQTVTVPEVRGVRKTATIGVDRSVSFRVTIEVPEAAAGLSLYPLVVLTQDGQTFTAAAATRVLVG